MIKKMAWNTFKNTGDINTFLEFVEIENVEKDILKDVEGAEAENEVEEEKSWELLKQKEL